MKKQNLLNRWHVTLFTVCGMSFLASCAKVEDQTSNTGAEGDPGIEVDTETGSQSDKHMDEDTDFGCRSPKIRINRNY